MSRSLPSSRAALPALRRSATAVQFGIDPRTAILVDGLSAIASSALVRLDGSLTRGELIHLIPDFDELLDQLNDHHLLDDDPGPNTALSQLRRERSAHDIAALALTEGGLPEAIAVMTRRAASTVIVRGNDRAAAHVAVGLAAAGIGVVTISGPDRVPTSSDLTPVGPVEPEISWIEQVSEAIRRHGAHPHSTAKQPSRPAVAVICSAADADLPWTDPELADDLMSDGVPHLPVAVSGAAARVGPLVIPGRTPCLVCVDLRARDDDRAWPALANQLRLRHPQSLAHDGVLATAASAFAVAQVLRVIDHPATAHESASASAVIEFRHPDALGIPVPVVVHPACGCGWGG
ncbi:MAG: hypothetical protein WCI29_05030 [Actinomycetes bacterium]